MVGAVTTTTTATTTSTDARQPSFPLGNVLS